MAAHHARHVTGRAPDFAANLTVDTQAWMDVVKQDAPAKLNTQRAGRRCSP